MNVTAETFEADVVGRSYELPVVVDFWAEWCGPCLALGPVLEREVAARDGELALAKVDVDANQSLALEYGIRGIPAVKAFRNGHVVSEFVGAQPSAAVARFLDDLLGPSEAERLVGELRESGGAPEIVAALDEHDEERALVLILDRVEGGDTEERESMRQFAVALFGELGEEHPLTQRYRRRLAAVLY